jgi:hypothetical protein
VAALLLCWCHARRRCGGLYVGTMVGAVLTHLKAGETGQIVAPLVFLTLAVVVGLARRHEVVAPFNRLFARGGRRGRSSMSARAVVKVVDAVRTVEGAGFVCAQALPGGGLQPLRSVPPGG